MCLNLCLMYEILHKYLKFLALKIHKVPKVIVQLNNTKVSKY